MSVWLLIALLALPVIGVGGTVVNIVVRKLRGKPAGSTDRPLPRRTPGQQGDER